ncbi:MAG: sulfite exporter TauE/SafE family protein [Hyphomicrobium sp.]|uniref:sulfite exporter TauE/SafE family protein n=1 Tax=Hyphomicrobium sp. TaxID=82 RepID=UPI003D138044
MSALAALIAGGFTLGLASTLHCAGMCGCIASAVMLAGGPQPPREGARVLALMHAGRIASYALAGAAVGALGAPAVAWLDRELAFRIVQWAGAMALMWIGLSTAGALPPLSALDRLLAPVADLVARMAKPVQGRGRAALAAGLAWGLMPCAMVYGALFTAMLTGSAASGAAVMAAFGLGTLPGLIASAAGFRLLSRAGARKRFRLAAGLAIGAAGFLSVWVPHRDAGVICAPRQSAELTEVNLAR